MNLKTMALQISKDNWSIAVAILGSRFAAQPQPDVIGCFLVINTFDTYRPQGRSGRVSSYAAHYDLSLANTWFNAEEFNAMYSYDKRRKNLEEAFFEIEKVADLPPRQLIDPVTQKLDELVQTYNETGND